MPIKLFDFDYTIQLTFFLHKPTYSCYKLQIPKLRTIDSDTKLSVGRGDSSHFPHIYNSTKTGRAGIVCSSVMVVPHMTFMHSEYP